ncbi:MAG: hypothetical protein AAB392_01670 [Patescibacteria group bacterium]
MPRVQFNDVTPPDKRSIRNIPIPNQNRRNKTEPLVDTNPQDLYGNKVSLNIEKAKPLIPPPPPIIVEDTTAPESPKNSFSPKTFFTKSTFSKPYKASYFHDDGTTHGGGKRRKVIFGGLSALVIASFILIMMTVFSSARVSITPKTENIAVSMTVEASSNSLSGDSVPYEIINFSKTKNMTVEASEEEMLERKASGKITIYNDFSKDPQRLIIRTRFESPEGLIYRIPESIVIPGKTASGPGSIEVEVFADESGEKYNIGKTDFTIPGFKNDSKRYNAFYAKSSREMTGGFVGKVKKIEEGLRKATLEKLDLELKSEIQREVSSQVASDLVLIEDSIWFTSKELPQEDSDDEAILTQEVSGFAIVLKKANLSKEITDEYIASSTEWQNIDVIINDFSSLKITHKPETVDKGAAINLTLEGGATATAVLNKEDISNTLKGVKRDQISEKMQMFLGIESVRASIRPAWKKAFPERSEKIFVDIEQ